MKIDSGRLMLRALGALYCSVGLQVFYLIATKGYDVDGFVYHLWYTNLILMIPVGTGLMLMREWARKLLVIQLIIFLCIPFLQLIAEFSRRGSSYYIGPRKGGLLTQVLGMFIFMGVPGALLYMFGFTALKNKYN